MNRQKYASYDMQYFTERNDNIQTGSSLFYHFHEKLPNQFLQELPLNFIDTYHAIEDKISLKFPVLFTQIKANNHENKSSPLRPK